MGWNDYKNGRAGGGPGGKAFVEEGNVKLFVFTEAQVRVRFVTDSTSVEDVMRERGCLKEEAAEILYSEIALDRWIMPRPYWEHQIKEIVGKRYFSTAACPGRGMCPMCDENEAAKAQGVSENKLLPYPLRKKYIVPAYVYDMKEVLFIRASEEFFDDIATYIDKNGPQVDFDIYKVGKGFQVKYKAIFSGPSDARLAAEVDAAAGGVIAPRDVNLYCGADELARRISGRPGTGQRPAPAPQQPQSQQPAPQQPQSQQPAPQQPPGDAPFRLPFGSFKGMTLDDLVKAGNGEYIKFLAENSAGEVRARAREFLGLA